MTLTTKQRKVYDFIKSYFNENRESPTYQEIQSYFNFKSLGSVVDYISYLKRAGFLRTNSSHSTRSLELVEQTEPNVLVPILGAVAAGSPLTIFQQEDYSNNLSVPSSMVRGECYALKVRGDSMVEDGIFDGDYVIIKSQTDARNGETVVANVDGSATIKVLEKKGALILLHPANPAYKPIKVQGGNFDIQGILVGLIRKY